MSHTHTHTHNSPFDYRRNKWLKRHIKADEHKMFASEMFTRVLGLYLFHKRTDTRPEAEWRQVRICFLPERSSLACTAKHGGHVMSELARHVSWNVRAWSCCEPLTGVWIISCTASAARAGRQEKQQHTALISSGDLCAGEELKLNRTEVFT